MVVGGGSGIKSLSERYKNKDTDNKKE